MMKKYLVSGFALLVSACATSYQPSYIYSEILVVNNSRELIQDVTISVPKTGRVFSCGNIAPLGVCSNRFGKRRYNFDPIKIDWGFGNEARQTEEFVVPVPAYFSTGVVLKGVLEISPQGDLKAYFDQDTPSF
jgi:hypothetical protein